MCMQLQENEEFTKMFQKIANAYEVCWEGLYIVYKTLLFLLLFPQYCISFCLELYQT